MRRVRRLVIINNVFVASFASFSLLSDTVLLGRLKKKFELTSDNGPVPLPKNLQNLVQTVMSEMNLNSREKSLIKPYLKKGFDVSQYGYAGPGLAFGAILGIPQNFIFNTNIPFKVLSMVDDVTLAPESYESEALKNALFLSEDAKKFGIAQEIYEAIHPSHYAMILLPITLLIVTNLLILWSARVTSPKFKSASLLFQSHVLLFGVTLYFVISDLMSVYKEGISDFKAASVGKSYLEGGIEYYEKMIKRNKTIKSINKEAPYMPNGDINITWLRTTHMPLLRRVTYLKDLKKTVQEKKEPPNIWDYIYLKEILLKIN